MSKTREIYKVEYFTNYKLMDTINEAIQKMVRTRNSNYEDLVIFAGAKVFNKLMLITNNALTFEHNDATATTTIKFIGVPIKFDRSVKERDFVIIDSLHDNPIHPFYWYNPQVADELNWIKTYKFDDCPDTIRYGLEYLARVTIDKNKTEEELMLKKLEIKKVIYNAPATIVYWADGDKTVVKAQDGEPFDKEKGLAMAMVKRMNYDKGNYNNIFRKWC